MKKLLIILLVGLFSCQKEAQEVIHNGQYTVEFLFEHEGCKIYRFEDNRTVYWADCRGKISSDYESGSSKSRVHHKEETIITDSLDVNH